MPNMTRDYHSDRLQDIIKYLINETGYLSRMRIHELLYLTELELIKEKEPLGIDFEPYRNGVYSEEVDSILDDLDEVERELVRFGNQRLTKFSGIDSKPHLSPLDERVAERIYREFASLDTVELIQRIRHTDPFEETKIGHEMGLPSKYKDRDTVQNSVL